MLRLQGGKELGASHGRMLNVVSKREGDNNKLKRAIGQVLEHTKTFEGQRLVLLKYKEKPSDR